MELADSPEQLLALFAGALRFLLEALSVGSVLVGLIATARLASVRFRPRRRAALPSNATRLTFGSWLSMALEFQLGADIVATTTSPSGQNLIQLGAVALIRTFLNVFLARELEAEARLEERNTETLPDRP